MTNRPSSPAVVPVYCKCPRLREQLLAPPLSGVEVAWTDAWDDFTEVWSGAEAGVYCTPDYTTNDSARLRKVADASVGGPSLVVVTPLSLGRLQLLREMDRSRFQVVWAEEVADRLLVGLQRAGWHMDPLHILASRILASVKPRPAVEKALRITCGLANATTNTNSPPPHPPPQSVKQLAHHVYLAPDTLRRYWQADIPLRCGLKEFLGWAVLLWAVPLRATKSWYRICSEGKVERRTLERLAHRKVGCTLAVAAQNPDRVTSAFEAWVAERSDRNGATDRPA